MSKSVLFAFVSLANELKWTVNCQVDRDEFEISRPSVDREAAPFPFVLATRGKTFVLNAFATALSQLVTRVKVNYFLQQLYTASHR